MTDGAPDLNGFLGLGEHFIGLTPEQQKAAQKFQKEQSKKAAKAAEGVMDQLPRKPDIWDYAAVAANIDAALTPRQQRLRALKLEEVDGEVVPKGSRPTAPREDGHIPTDEEHEALMREIEEEDEAEQAELLKQAWNEEVQARLDQGLPSSGYASS